MPFKIGSFNILPSAAVVTIMVAGIGALPYGLKWLLNGEKPTLYDRFENYLQWRKGTWDKGAPYAVTREYAFDREELEEEWRKWHVAAGNVPGAALDPKDAFNAKLQ